MIEIGTSYYHLDFFDGPVPEGVHKTHVLRAFGRAEERDGMRLGPIRRATDMEAEALKEKPAGIAARMYVAEVVEIKELAHG